MVESEWHSGTQPWPAPVLPDVCCDGITSNAELRDRIFAFLSGSTEKQYCSECQPSPFWWSHPVSSKRVPCPELPSPSLFCSPAVLCSFACMDGITHSNTNTSPSQPSSGMSFSYRVSQDSNLRALGAW